MTSVQVPLAFRPAKADSGICGLNVAKNGAPPLWIGVPALSSKTVLVKLAVFVPWPTPLNSGMDNSPGPPCRSTASPSGRGRWDNVRLIWTRKPLIPELRRVSLDQEVVGDDDRGAHLCPEWSHRSAPG